MWIQRFGGGSLAHIFHGCHASRSASLLCLHSTQVKALAACSPYQRRRHQYQYQHHEGNKTDGPSCADESNGESTPAGNWRCPASTYAGVRVKSHILSPVFEEHHSLWQWRTVVWRETFHAVPFLLHCAPGVLLQHPFIHHTLVESITTKSGVKGHLRATEPSTTESGDDVKRRCAQLVVPSPIGMLAATDSGASACHPLAEWADELFFFWNGARRGRRRRQAFPPPCIRMSSRAATRKLLSRGDQTPG
ncbi:hypothetical protein TraAM80_05173 [Trypanosoma rangeli]|uniref:Uncharacterized protein n=1 Tax=Trypanosoma rangeli TaxID=5698 RepID=A0A422NG86_TRYRA|nr:uncharacterized protein TraAM80_05173 [Trypanosoma rangeli]RNF04457.1 hypothetical protein TraAM80_05173 [Trypanosoma rangeli]|eukprot:RNF04457.1 hypothetical protein TraAM80_05173 [Trypanosoma rangeli]